MNFSPWLAASMLVVAATSPANPVANAGPENSPPPIDSFTSTHDSALGQDSGDRMTVSVSVEGKGPYRFLVDTGAERTVISRQLAKHLQLESGRSARLHSLLGVKGVETVYIPRLEVSTNVISVVNAPALEAGNIGADGLLGMDSLHSQRVLFDFKAKTMSITPSSKREARLDGDTIVVRAKSRRGHLIFTNARIDGQKVTVIVDTGSQFTVGNMALYRKLQSRKPAPLPSITIHTVTGETMQADVSILQKVDLGDVALTKLASAFTDAHIFRKLDLADKPALLLGMNAMRAFDQISIDFASKKVRFVLPQTSMRDDVRMAGAAPVPVSGAM
jgi:predicted aspartyl protease